MDIDQTYYTWAGDDQLEMVGFWGRWR